MEDGQVMPASTQVELSFDELVRDPDSFFSRAYAQCDQEAKEWVQTKMAERGEKPSEYRRDDR